MSNEQKDIDSFYAGKLDSTSDVYKKEASLELLSMNLRREKILSIMLLFIVTALFCLDAVSTEVWTKDTHVFLKFSALHLALILVPAIFLVLRYTNRMLSLENLTDSGLLICRIQHFSLNLYVLIICSLISVNNILDAKFPFSYVTAMLCIASLIFLNPYERHVAFLLSYVIYIVAISGSDMNTYDLAASMFFITLLTILALMVSGINYKAQMNSLIDSRIIVHKNGELADMNRMIDDTLKRRTDELSQEVEYKKLKTFFFANMSHELRTPVTVISTATQMLGYLFEGCDANEKRKKAFKYLGIITKNSYRLTRLVSNLIDITKIDAGEFQVEIKNHNIIRIVEDISLSAARYLQNRKLCITFDTDAEEEVIACDSDKIERIVLNLLSNAVKFTPEGGSISVSITDREDMLDIHVKDTGIGIPSEMHGFIFKRFMQVDACTTRSREGSGVGLSIVKSLVELHNGTITLVSEQGKGSEFIVSIPKTRLAGEEEAVPENGTASEKQRIEKIKIEFSDIYS